MTSQRAARVSWKTFWSTLAPLLAGVFAAVALLVDVPPWLAIALVAAAAVVVGAAGRLVAYRGRMFERLEPAAQQTVAVWIAIADAVYAVWATVCVLRPDLAWWWLLLPGLGGLTYLAARGHEYLLTQLRQPARPPAAPMAVPQLALTAGPAAGPREGEPLLVFRFRQSLQVCGLGWMGVVGEHEPVTDAGTGRLFGYRYRLRSPSRITVPTGNGRTREVIAPKPPADAADRIAQAMSEVSGIDIAPDWVTIAKATDRAGDYLVQVNTEDVMAQVRPYHESPAALRWTTVATPAAISYGMDGQPFAWNFCHHGRIIGGTQNGKSSAIQRMMAHLALCEDAIIWAASVEKFYDLVGPILEPYLGTEHRSPIDWLAWTPERVLEMLIAAMHITRWRQRQPHAKRRQFKKLFVFVDELAFAAKNRTVKGMYQGQVVTISQMLAFLARAGEGAGVYLVLASQKGTHADFGDAGNEIAPNMGWSVALRSSDQAETGRMTGLYRLPRIKHPGQAYVEPGDGLSTTSVKFEYIQTDDASKPILSDGPRVSEVFWNRRRFVTDMDEGSAKAGGVAYAARERHVTDELMAALTGAVDFDGDDDTAVTSAAPAPEQGMRDAFTAALKLRGVNIPTPRPTPTAAAADNGGGVAVLTAHRSIPERILAYARRCGGQAQRADIISTLESEGVGEQSVQNALSEMVNDTGQMRRVGRGLYEVV